MNHLKKLREKNKFTQKNLGQLVGINSKHISFIENEERNPLLDLVLKLPKVFKCSIEGIFLSS